MYLDLDLALWLAHTRPHEREGSVPMYLLSIPVVIPDEFDRINQHVLGSDARDLREVTREAAQQHVDNVMEMYRTLQEKK